MRTLPVAKNSFCPETKIMKLIDLKVSTKRNSFTKMPCDVLCHNFLSLFSIFFYCGQLIPVETQHLPKILNRATQQSYLNWGAAHLFYCGSSGKIAGFCYGRPVKMEGMGQMGIMGRWQSI